MKRSWQHTICSIIAAVPQTLLVRWLAPGISGWHIGGIVFGVLFLENLSDAIADGWVKARRGAALEAMMRGVRR